MPDQGVVVPNTRITPPHPPKKSELTPVCEVETAVVTAPVDQNVTHNMDSVGRGNSVIIQLPRTKRN
jgi:hypothetical protein